MDAKLSFRARSTPVEFPSSRVASETGRRASRRHRRVADTRAAAGRKTVHALDDKQQTVVVLGGTGRVGSAAAAALLRDAGQGVEVALAGRSSERWGEAKGRHRELSEAKFVQVDVNDKASVMRAIEGADLVINTAGPFQRRDNCAALEAAIDSGVKYLDVCDDSAYGAKAKALNEKAKNANISAITCAGIYPGVSNLMALDTAETMKAEFRADVALSLIHI